MHSSPRQRRGADSQAQVDDQAPAFWQTRFALSVAQLGELKTAGLALLPEIAFVGRSNAGKSSVINVLANRRRLAFTSKTPGRTQLLNFFALDRRARDGAPAACAYLVDLPGYGFAKVDNATRQRWDDLVGGYLQSRRMLAGVVLVIDARRGITHADEGLLAWIERRAEPEKLHLHLLLNKADQLNTVGRRQAMAAAEARAETLPMPTSVQCFSALKHTGVAELKTVVAHMLATDQDD